MIYKDKNIFTVVYDKFIKMQRMFNILKLMPNKGGVYLKIDSFKCCFHEKYK